MKIDHHNTRRYDREFYDFIKDRSYTSAMEIAPKVAELIDPQSIVDIGCGSGDWLAVFRELGVDDTLGIDDGAGSQEALRIPSECFRRADLRQAMVLDRSYDMAMCLEVAEHLPTESALKLIESLTSLAPVVLFSAAVPQQPGVHHVNCRWPEYWIDVFARHHYEAFDVIRSQFWSNPRVSWWYAQNTLLFVRDGHSARYPKLLSCGAPTMSGISVVHPRLFELCCDPEKLSPKAAFKQLLRCCAANIKGRLIR